MPPPEKLLCTHLCPSILALCIKELSSFYISKLYSTVASILLFEAYDVQTKEDGYQYDELGGLMSIRTAVKALAVLVVGREVGRDLVADGAGHRLVGHVLRCNVQPSVGYQRERGVAIE